MSIITPKLCRFSESLDNFLRTITLVIKRMQNQPDSYSSQAKNYTKIFFKLVLLFIFVFAIFTFIIGLPPVRKWMRIHLLPYVYRVIPYDLGTAENPVIFSKGLEEQQDRLWKKMQEKLNNIELPRHQSVEKYGDGDPQNAKIFILGIDGADWKVLVPLISKGLLPNFGKLLATSSYGYLETDEACSPISWTSIATGKSKLKAFTEAPINCNHLEIFSQSTIKSKRLWDILAASNGRGMAILNYYFTPDPNDFPNALLYQASPQIEHPKDFFNKKDRSPVDPPYPLKYETEAFLYEVISETDSNFITTIIRETDYQQHKILFFFLLKHLIQADFMLPAAGLNISSFNQAVDELEKLYQSLDFILGKAIQKFGQDYIFIVSDHGFHSGPPTICIDPAEEILRQIGLFNDTYTENGRSQLNLVIGNFNVQWDYQKWCYPILKFKSSRKKIVYRAFAKEIIFEPANVNDTPSADRLFQYLSNVIASSNLDNKQFFHLDRKKNRISFCIDKSAIQYTRICCPVKAGPLFFTYLSNFHTPNDPGIFIGSGPALAKGRIIAKASLFDIVPTILYLKSKPIGKDMDGHVIQEIIDPAFLNSHPIQYIDTYDDEKWVRARGRHAFSPSQEEIEKLRSLGYFR